MKAFTLLFLLTSAFALNAQSPFELKLDSIGQIILNSADEKERKAANKLLINWLEKGKTDQLIHVHSENVQSIGVFTSKDSLLKLFNWAIPQIEGGYQYECILIYDGKHRYRLNDTQHKMEELVALSANEFNWPGALYYQLVEKKSNLQTYYTLLGWDEYDGLTNRKIIEVMWFTKSGMLNIGAGIFKPFEEPIQKRQVFHYADQNSMQLRYDTLNDRILFDHLSPSSSSLKGLYEYYGPDFTYDALEWSGRYWELKEDVDPDQGLKKKKKDFKLDPKDLAKDTVLYKSK